MTCVAGNAPQRVRWAVDLLDVQPSDTILEVGCGNGLAAALIASRLKTGSVTAIDRSAVMVSRAYASNREAIAAGRVTVLQLDLLGAAMRGLRYPKVVAVNVNAFWTDPARSLPALRRLMEPSGTAYLVYEPPSEAQLRHLAERLPQEVAAEGFEVIDVPVRAGGQKPMLAAIFRSLDQDSGWSTPVARFRRYSCKSTHA